MFNGALNGSNKRPKVVKIELLLSESTDGKGVSVFVSDDCLADSGLPRLNQDSIGQLAMSKKLLLTKCYSWEDASTVTMKERHSR